MTVKRFHVNDLVKYNYSEIGEYIDENHTDKPLRNDELVDLLNEQHEGIQRLQDENYGLKQTVAQLVKEFKEISQRKEEYKIQPYAIMKRNGGVE